MKNCFLKTTLFLLTALLFVGKIQAQQSNPAWKADKLYNEFAFTKAIEEYEKVLTKFPNNSDAVRKLAECYRLTNNSEKMEQLYGRVAKLPDAKPIEKYYYAQALMYNAKYDQAKAVFIEYSTLASSDERAKNSISAIDKMDEFFADSSRSKISKLTINSPEADFSPVFFNEGVVFVSSRETGAKDRNHAWTGKPYLALYYARGKGDNLRSPEVFSKDLLSKYNDGPACFSKDGTELYLTRNNDQVASRKDKTVKLKIVMSKFSDGKWSDFRDFPFDSDKFNCAHAWMTQDGKRIYFSSDMSGGFGGMDIYYADRQEDGWSAPVNLGNKINTKGNELFPFVNVDNTLYFSSDGHIGMGGLDIYECKYNNGVWSEAHNMGYPVNTHMDDFGMILDKEGEHGYISSNRTGGKGDDDVYAVTLIKKILVSGTVYDKSTRKPLDKSDVVLKDRDGKEIGHVTTKADGTYEFELEMNKQFAITASKAGYSTETEQVSTVNPKSTKLVVDFFLEKQDYSVEGIVSDKETTKPIEGSKVVLLDPDGKELASYTTKENGYYTFPLEPNKVYRVKASKEGYFSKSEEVSTKGIRPGVIRKDLPLEKLILNKPIRLDNIYYDLAKWNIRPDAAKELDKLVQVLKDNPTIVIELSSHTDCRASDEYNMNLSDKRAKSAAQYIIDKGGIPKERITGKGYGETMLINRCANGVKCSEAEHQENRRTEFKVLKF